MNRRRGFTLIETLIVVVIVLILLSIVMVNAPKMIMGAREMAVIREIQTVHQAQAQYLSQFGVYAASLEQLGPARGGQEGPESAGMIPDSLAKGKAHSYLFAITPLQGGYAVFAVPEIFGNSGRRSFYSDQDLAIHESWTQDPATPESPIVE